MVAPFIGAAARMAEKKLAEKGGKEGAKRLSRRELAEKEAEEAARRTAIENAKESAKGAAKTAAKTAGGAGVAGTTYLIGEGMSPSGTGPVTEAIKRKMYEKEEEPVKKAKGGAISSASKRADGCAIRGKTRGKMM